MSARRICIVTGTRADYGLLAGLLRAVDGDPALDLQLVATGMHLSPAFGETVRAIEADGFAVDASVDMLLSSDTPVGVAKSMGLGTIGFADVFDRLRPDWVVLLGDRFEMLAAAQAALVARVPIAHIHGGETTEGAVDESIRHAITKMAHLHFVAAEPFRRRVVQMGEPPDRVVTVGAPGLDAIRGVRVLTRTALEAALGLALGEPTFLITYHPATLQPEAPHRSLEALLRALDGFPKATLVFTGANADPCGRRLNRRIARYVERRAERACFHDSLGTRRYVSAMHHADVVVGNSSSGIIEAPAVPVPTVNLGDRQKGRPRAASVIDCAEAPAAVEAAIRRALSPAFRRRLDGVTSPYGDGRAASRMCRLLKATTLQGLQKPFYDLPERADVEPERPSCA